VLGQDPTIYLRKDGTLKLGVYTDYSEMDNEYEVDGKFNDEQEIGHAIKLLRERVEVEKKSKMTKKLKVHIEDMIEEFGEDEVKSIVEDVQYDLF